MIIYLWEFSPHAPTQSAECSGNPGGRPRWGPGDFTRARPIGQLGPNLKRCDGPSSARALAAPRPEGFPRAAGSRARPGFTVCVGNDGLGGGVAFGQKPEGAWPMSPTSGPANWKRVGIWTVLVSVSGY